MIAHSKVVTYDVRSVNYLVITPFEGSIKNRNISWPLFLVDITLFWTFAVAVPDSIPGSSRLVTDQEDTCSLHRPDLSLLQHLTLYLQTEHTPCRVVRPYENRLKSDL